MARIQSDLKYSPVLAPQDIMDCCTYNQGCDGGFPYLIARWGRDEGFIEESCLPYHGSTGSCGHKCSELSKRVFVGKFEEVGGYLGACNEAAMIEALQHGPISASFMCYGDFFSYRGGIYEHKDDSNAQWEEVSCFYFLFFF